MARFLQSAAALSARPRVPQRTATMLLLAATTALTACGGSDGRSALAPPVGTNPGGGGAGDPIEATAFNMSVESKALAEDGVTPVNVTFTVFVPAHNDGDTFPLIVHSHGFGGSRIGDAEAMADPAEPAAIGSTTSVFARVDDQVRLLWDAGYAVVSFDERGFGRDDDGDDGNSGAIQIMDPDFETMDAITVLDWVDDNVDGLARDDTGNIIAGAIGGSYGGGYQFLLAQFDDRLDALVPTATWYDLKESLLPNNVIKKGYSTGLCALIATDGAESGTRTQAACDQAADTGPGAAPNRYREDITMMQDELLEAFGTHGNVELERRHNDASDAFTMRPLDVLLIQGNRDILFSNTQAYENYRFLSGIGGDVRLITMENGHTLAGQTRNNPGSAGPLGPTACGQVNAFTAMRAWFDLKLRGNAAAEASIPDEVCISLDNTTGVLLTEYPLASGDDARFDAYTLTFDAQNITAQQNNIQSPGGGLFLPLAAPISGDGFVLAGVPTAAVTITDADALAATNNGTTAFLGTAIRRNGTVILVDDQATAIRAQDMEQRTGDAPLPIKLAGVGENLLDGDEVGLIVYGNYDVFETGTGSAPVNFGANNRFSIAGSARFPVLQAAVQSRPTE